MFNFKVMLVFNVQVTYNMTSLSGADVRFKTFCINVKFEKKSNTIIYFKYAVEALPARYHVYIFICKYFIYNVSSN